MAERKKIRESWGSIWAKSLVITRKAKVCVEELSGVRTQQNKQQTTTFAVTGWLLWFGYIALHAPVCATVFFFFFFFLGFPRIV